MNFELPRTTALFGKLNFREENRGKSGKVDAIDVPFEITAGRELLDLIIGYDKEGLKLSDYAFDADDGHPLIPNCSLKALHKREGLEITVWDGKAKKKGPVELKEARIQAPEIKLLAPFGVLLESKIQIAEPEDDILIRFRHLRGQHADILIVGQNLDLFSGEGAEPVEGELVGETIGDAALAAAPK